MKTIALLVAAAASLKAWHSTYLLSALNTLLDVTSIVFTAVPILASFVAVGVKGRVYWLSLTLHYRWLSLACSLAL